MKSKIKYIVFLCLLSVTLSLNVNAITLKETTTSGDEFDTIEANTTIIGVTKFTPQEVITAAKATKAGADDAKLYLKQNNNDDEDYESPTIYIYYGEIGGWYSLDENNEATYIEDEELINKLSNLNIYYVNNDLKTFKLYKLVDTTKTSLPKGVVYDRGIITASALVQSFVIYTMDNDVIEYVLTENGFSRNRCFDFNRDSWDVIATNVSNDTSYYPVGCTKKIYDGRGGVKYRLRVANNTTPEVCSGEGFSQTACGFVVEFDRTVETHRMNPYTDGTTNGDGNKGGWEYSEMRSYLNNDIYSSLPTELKNVMIDTTVVSGHGSNDSANFTTTDKLYLLSSVEVFGTPDDDSGTETRQLDYYANLGVTQSNHSGAKKENAVGVLSRNWWLRSARLGYNDTFSFVDRDGAIYDDYSDSINGVAPAFRIG